MDTSRGKMDIYPSEGGLHEGKCSFKANKCTGSLENACVTKKNERTACKMDMSPKKMHGQPGKCICHQKK